MEAPNIENLEFRYCTEKFLQYLENMSYRTGKLDNYRRILVRIDYFYDSEKHRQQLFTD